MSDWLVIAVALAISYVLGSIPTGLWLGKALDNCLHVLLIEVKVM